MAIFKNLLAVTALANVAFAGTAYSSDVASLVTSVELVTSVTSIFVTPPAASSSTHCNTLTVTEVAPPSTVTVIAPPPSGFSGVSSAGGVVSSSKSVDIIIQTSDPAPTVSKPTIISRKTETVTTPSVSATLESSVVYGTANFTGTAFTTSAFIPILSRSHTFSHTYHMNGTKTTSATGTGSASASASYTAPSLPPFTDAADATNVGAAVLFGGVLMALFGA